jgi:glycosyltransferase involved in cell wall biosynthesis
MRVLYDHQAFTIQEYGGISRYFYELLKNFKDSLHIDMASSLLFSNNEYIRNKEIITSTSFIRCFTFQKKIEAMNLLNEIKSKSVYQNEVFDIFHPTYYDPYYLKSVRKKPVVITFHDLIHEKFKQYDHQTLNNKKKVLLRADQIIAVSQNSKNDLIEYYHIPDERIQVIHLASSLNTSHIVNVEILAERFLLYVGNREDYKNFIFFITAIAPLLIKDKALFVYCAGGGAFTKVEQKLFQQLKISLKVKQQPGNDQNLKLMYTQAIAFFCPSVYEGFGIPLLEAMNCGCPIVVSKTSSLPEVAGDAALYFNPLSSESILAAATTITTNTALRLQLKNSGLLRAKEFSWQKTADSTLKVYQTLL